ncbi:unnamed protein product [Parnassius apollo]|uniref:(apollo) hypothetical protein n=1 Tax=Parnassius apollo TaxID=110799 RepID=A0A8S3XCJ3_PARAO|nr:unnamed protein product [Parnassius apollo]
MSGFHDIATNFRCSTNNINEGIVRQQSRQKTLKLWRSNSLVNIAGNSNKKSPVYESSPNTERFRKYGNTESVNILDGIKNRKQIWRLKDFESTLNNWDTLVTIVLVHAKGLPLPPDDGAAHELYCKFSCVLDLSTLEKERTHEIWQQLDDGYGFIHLSLTMCVIRDVPAQRSENIKTDDLQHKDHNIHDLKSDWKLVGSLHVKVIKAKGLSGKPSAYCKLELNNERVRTHRTNSRIEPMWNKSYVLDVHDVTSVLKITVLGSSLPNALLDEFLGQVSIPLSLFEWDNRELSALALLVWLIFCYHLKPWAVPLILLLPFLFFWTCTWIQGESTDNDTEDLERTQDSRKDNKGLGEKINDMQGVTTTVSFALNIALSLIERIINLITFKVPFLSYVAMSLLLVVSVMLYFMPFNYLLMLFGIYKFIRKYLNPDRMLNNDLIDFISRIPDNKLLKDWKELNVPEPTQ